VPNSCEMVSPGGFKLNGTFRLDPGTCVPTPVQPTGSVVPTGQATSICCTSTGP
jgi:hypothetical protein